MQNKMSVDEKFICKIFILQWKRVVKHLIWYLHTTEILFIIKPKNHSILVISFRHRLKMDVGRRHGSQLRQVTVFCNWWKNVSLFCICHKSSHLLKHLLYYIFCKFWVYFVCLEFIVPLVNFSLIWRRHHCRWSYSTRTERWSILPIPPLVNGRR